MNAIYGWSSGRRYALSAGGVLLATLMLSQLSADFQVTNIALLLLLVVLLIATTIGMGPAILASVLAFLGFNFFFVEPLHSFRVTDPQDDLRLITFLVVAITGSSLAGRAREQANAAARGASELAALYGFSLRWYDSAALLDESICHERRPRRSTLAMVGPPVAAMR